MLRRTLAGIPIAALLSTAAIVPIASPADAVVTATLVAGRSEDRASYSPFTSAEADHVGGNWSITWTTRNSAPVTVWSSTDGGSSWHKVATQVTSGRVEVAYDGHAPHELFKLNPRQGAPLTIAGRRIEFQDADMANFRDVGGYRTTNGQWVRMGMLYRSNALTLAPADAQVAADELHVGHVYDLRTPPEITKTPDVVPAGSTYQNINVIANLRSGGPYANPATPEQYFANSRYAYNFFVTNPTAQAAIGELLTDLADSKGVSVFHCSAGQDRTGVASALLLSLLGVPEKTVEDDYALTFHYLWGSQFLQDYDASVGMSQQQRDLQKYAYTHPDEYQASTIQLALDVIKQDYGSVDNYASQALGLDRDTVAKLKAQYLSPASD
ncbi:MAG TPA: tyrosine-protein phosphatase [Amycolatopsis sp.]|nr:tyrosine-protein phosphatase [Amycolatopsis sp.]